MENPYKSPSTPLPPTSSSADEPTTPLAAAERIRSERLGAERALKQNVLCCVGVFVLLSVTMLIASYSHQCSPRQKCIEIEMSCVLSAAALAGGCIYWGVRRLAAWSRVPLVVLCFLSLVLFPVGTVFGLLILMRVLVRRPPRLLSHEYEAIVRQTRHMDERTSLLAWVGLALIVILVIAVILIAQLPPEMRQGR